LLSLGQNSFSPLSKNTSSDPPSSNMPVASSSRRQRRLVRNRDPSSDAIEEDGPIQHSAEEDVEEDEDEDAGVRSKALKVKREKGLLDAGLGDIEDQPVDRTAMPKLGGMASDWASIRGVHTNSYNLAKDVAASFAEFAEGDEGEKTLVEIDQIMRRLIDTEAVLVSHENVLKDIQAQVATESITDIIKRYDEGCTVKAAEYEKKTSRQKYAKHDDYLKFKQAIFEIQNRDTPMPPINDFIPAETGDNSDDEDDIQVGGVTQDYKDPLTLTIFVDPYTSQVCGHSFSKESIMSYMSGKRSVKCPATGCDKTFYTNDLKPNKELAKKAKEAARRERMRDEEDSDEDEVIE